ncbi:MAG: hypothetical protein HY823_07610 [Acidobacteria bacterium]|nr:hypothetical protein [Acidobacteriota bacterium]
MRPAIASLALLAAAPLLADGEVGVLLDRQFGKAQSVQVAQTAVNGSYDAVSPSGMGFRVGASFLDIGVMAININATYHPKSEEDLVLNGKKVARFGAEYLAVGAGLDWKLVLNLHAGVEMRREKYSADLPAWNSLGSVELTRPWLKFGVGFSVPLVVVSPFARLEFAVPTTKNDKTGTPDELRKALAPQYQVALYGGIRF